MKRALSRPVVAWAFYDWANSAFATTVMAGFFPTFFRQYWSQGADATLTTWRLGLANGVAGFLIAVLAPLLGALADRSARRKHFVLGWTVVGVAASAALYFVGQGEWQLAVLLFVVGTMGFNGGIVFSDALLPQIAVPRDYDRVSALGYSLGYLGGGLLFAINVWMTLQPGFFGLASAAEAVRFSFLTVAAWWLLFSLPLAIWVHETPAKARQGGAALVSGWQELRATLGDIMRQRDLWLFLVAYWLYIDGVNTVIKMAVDYGMALGFPVASLLTALLITQFVAFPAALAFGWLGGRIGARRGILIGIAVYAALSLYAVFMTSVTEFYAMAVVVGLVQGGVQSLSRSLFGQFVPQDKSAEYYGFYNMMGKFATVIGPLLVGATAALSGSNRAGIGSLVLLFGVGGWLLWKVKAPRAL